MDEEDHEMVFIDPIRQRRERFHNCCVYILAVSLAVALLAVVGLAVGLGVVSSRQKSDESSSSTDVTCEKESCHELAKMVQAGLDTTVDPCVDFYNFSCGGWIRGNSIPPGYSSFSRFRDLDIENTRKLISVMNSDIDGDIEAVGKAKMLFRSCMDLDRLESVGSKSMLEVINYFGGWDLIQSYPIQSYPFSSGDGSGFSERFLDSDSFLIQKLAGSSAFFSFFVYVDDKNSSKYTLFLEQSGLSLLSPVSYFDPKESSKQLAALKYYIVGVLHLLNSSVPVEDYEEAADKIIELEMKMASVFVSAVDLRDPEGTYNKMTVADLTLNFPNPFNWTRVQQFLFSFLNASDISESDEVVVRTPSYFKNLSSVLEGTDNSTLYNYAMWHLTKEGVRYLSRDFLSVYYNFTEQITGTGEKDRNVTCLDLVQISFPIALSRPFTDVYFPSNAKSSVSQMISQIKEAFKDRLTKNTWIDEYTKKECKDKVDAITQRVAYPDLIHYDSYVDKLYESYSVNETDLLRTMFNLTFNATVKNIRRLGTPVDKTEWDIAPTAVNAYYNPSFNQFTFLEGILASPFFHADWPYYFRYGAFGVVIGHELTHGFDDQGQQYDKNGDLRPWWDSESVQRFKERQQCFRDQYSSYEVFGYHINGNLTLGENLADNGGLKTSYQAYRNVVNEAPQPKLPGVAYTPDQLFFIAFSQVWCSIYTPEYISNLVQTNPHSPGSYRVIGTLANSHEFADAFQCPKSSYMNPQKKCVMW